VGSVAVAPQRLKPFFRSKPLTQRLKRCSTQNQSFPQPLELALFPNLTDTEFFRVLSSRALPDFFVSFCSYLFVTLAGLLIMKALTAIPLG
jgi:hypothetical protein